MKRTELKRSGPPARTRKTPAAKAKKRADVLWSQYVKARDGCCLVCGRTEGVLHAHHVMIRSFNATRVDENNGKTACYQCHQDKLHGDPSFAVAFYTREYGIEGYAALRQKAYDGVGGKYPASYWLEAAERLQAKLGEL